jgi:exodeoxyribonuclease VII large subunit
MDDASAWNRLGPRSGVRVAETAAFSVAEFLKLVAGTLAEAFEYPVWVRGELRRISQHHNGHAFMELAQVGTASNRPEVQLDLVAWSNSWQRILAELRQSDTYPVVGQELRVLGRVDLDPRNGRVRLSVLSIDIEALLGRLAAEKRLLREKLKQSGLYEANSKLSPPGLPLRIGLLASAGSEGERDFLGVLHSSGVCYTVLAANTLVQGAEAPWTLVRGLRQLTDLGVELIAVVRGGGAKSDMAAFDREEVVTAVAQCPIPIFTGIGHTGDLSLVDEVAYAAHPTPTAAAQGVVALTLSGLDRLSQLFDQAWSLTSARVSAEAALLGRTATRLARTAEGAVSSEAGRLSLVHQRLRFSGLLRTERELARLEDRRRRLAAASQTELGRAGERLRQSTHRATQVAGQRLDRADRRLQLSSTKVLGLDPRRPLRQGFSITRDETGRLIDRAAGVSAGTILHTELVDGRLVSQVLVPRHRHLDRGATAGAP